MGASNLFRNLRPLFQYQSPKSIHDRLDDHDPREGWMLPQNTAGHHKANGTQIGAQTSKLPKENSTVPANIGHVRYYIGHVRYFRTRPVFSAASWPREKNPKPR